MLHAVQSLHVINVDHGCSILILGRWRGRWLFSTLLSWFGRWWVCLELLNQLEPFKLHQRSTDVLKHDKRKKKKDSSSASDMCNVMWYSRSSLLWTHLEWHKLSQLKEASLFQRGVCTHLQYVPTGGSLQSDRVALHHSTCVYDPLMWSMECTKTVWSYCSFTKMDRNTTLLKISRETHEPGL